MCNHVVWRIHVSLLPVPFFAQDASLSILGHSVLRRFYLEYADCHADFEAKWRESNIVSDVLQVDHTLKVFMGGRVR